MGDSFLTLDDLPPGGKTVLLRVDINSSINPETGTLLDDTRIRRHAATAELLAEAGARVAILAHQSRPGLLDCVPLARHARRLAHLGGAVASFRAAGWLAGCFAGATSISP